MLGALVFLFSLAVYLKTLCPTVSFGDSGELITAAYTLGVAHPPGSPTWCLLAKLFTFIPLGSLAYRVNLLSAFFASMTVLLIYIIMLRLARGSPFRHLASLAGSLLIAFSYSFWSYAVVAEVYSLNTFFIALVILLLLCWRERRERVYLYLLAFSLGLGIGNHYTIILILPAVLLFILLEKPSAFKIETSLLIVFFLLTGLSIFLYLPLRSLANPPIDFCNPETLKSFLKVILRRAYEPPELTHSGKEFLAYFDVYVRSLARQFSFPLVWLGVAGCWLLSRKDRLAGLFSLLVFYAYSLGIIFLSGKSPFPPPLEETCRISLYTPSYLIYGLWLGALVGSLGEKISRGNRKISYVVSGFILLSTLLLLKANYFENDKSNYTFAYDYGREVLEALEPGPILFTNGDQPLFILYYLHYVEGLKPDLVLLSGQLLSVPWYREEVQYKYPEVGEALKTEKKEEAVFSNVPSVNKIINKLSPLRPIYCSSPDLIKTDYLLPRGFVYRFKKEKASAPIYPEGLLAHIKNWSNQKIYKDKEARDCLSHLYNNLSYYFFNQGLDKESLRANREAREISPSYGQPHADRGIYLATHGRMAEAVMEFQKALRSNFVHPHVYFYLGFCYHSLNELDRAIEAYKMSLRLDPGQVKVHNNLGLVYVEKKDYPAAAKEFREALKIDPKYEAALTNLKKVSP